MMIVRLHEHIYIRRHTKYVSAERLIDALHKKNVKLCSRTLPPSQTLRLLKRRTQLGIAALLTLLC